MINMHVFIRVSFQRYHIGVLQVHRKSGCVKWLIRYSKEFVSVNVYSLVAFRESVATSSWFWSNFGICFCLKTTSDFSSYVPHAWDDQHDYGRPD